VKNCFLIIIILFHFGAIAETSQEELPYLFIPPVDIPEDFTEFEKQQINKLVVKGSTKQSVYQVMIGTPQISKRFKWAIHKINVKVSNTPDGFQIVAELRDARKNILINSITESQFPQLELYRRLEDIINRLFLPVEKDLELEVKSKPPKLKAEPQKTIQESKVATINFRERIMSLKTDVNDAVVKAGAVKAEKKKTDALKLNDPETTNKKTNSANAQTNAEENLRLGNEAALAPKPEIKPPLDIGHSIRVGYYNVNTNSQDNLLNTDSHPKYLLLDYEYALNWPPKSKVFHHVNVRYGKTLNKEEKEFAPYIGGSILEGYFFESLRWMPKAGIEIDTISFKNLPIPREGLKIANNRIFWFNVTSVNSFSLFSRDFRFALGYGIPLKIMSDYSGLDENPKATGSKINLTLAVLNLYKKFHLEVNYFKSEIEATSDRVTTFDTQGAGLNAFYNF
jgi:hypothetical protein